MAAQRRERKREERVRHKKLSGREKRQGEETGKGGKGRNGGRGG